MGPLPSSKGFHLIELYSQLAGDAMFISGGVTGWESVVLFVNTQRYRYAAFYLNPHMTFVSYY